MKRLLPLLISFLLVSCASYTISEARNKIQYPEPVSISTRYSEIKEAEEKEEEKIRMIEEEKAREERAKAVNYYPSLLSDLTYPFFFNPVKNAIANISDNLCVVLIPLGEEKLTQETLSSIYASISDLPFHIAALTGSLENQTNFASLLGLDAVTMEGGTVIFRSSVPSVISSDRMSLTLNENRKVDILVMDQKPLLPEGGDTEEVLTLVENLEDRDIEDIVGYVSQGGNTEKIFFLSSYSPSSTDWSDWSAYSYRRDQSFMISDILEDLKWQDAYDVTRFSVETESGVTRRNGDVEERLDFIWSKGLIVSSSFTLPLENSTSSAVVATFLIP